MAAADITSVSPSTPPQYSRTVPGPLAGRRRFPGRGFRGGQVVGFFQCFVTQPEDVQVRFVSFQQLVVFVATPAAFGSFFRPDGIAAIGILGVVAFKPDDSPELELANRVSCHRQACTVVGSDLCRPDRSLPWTICIGPTHETGR